MESLLYCQFDLAERIKKAEINYKKSPKERITIEYVHSRLEALEKIWAEFFTDHKQLVRSSDPKLLNASAYVTSDVYERTEETYINYKCTSKTVLNQFKDREFTNNPKSSFDSAASHVKLPKILIPTFSGKYSEWVTFRDLFMSIHNHEGLDNVQKLRFLKGYLAGEAEQFLRHIPVTGENYIRCWEQLESRYNNKKYLSHCILKRLLSQKNATCESAAFLKDLIDTSTECLNALENLGIDVKSWDIIVIHILSLKLDDETRKHWELNVTSNTSSDALPTFVQFKEFITNRFRALEFMEPKRMSKPSGFAKNTVLHAMSKQENCKFCSEDHKINVCKGFLNEECDSRRNFVQENGICFNCLGNNHSARFCKSTNTCRVCKRRHHSLLHPKSAEKENTAVNAATLEAEGNEEEDIIEEENEGEELSANTAIGNRSVLLATALVKAEACNGSDVTLRCLLDQGAQASFITEAAAQLLRLKRVTAKKVISGLGGGKNVISNSMVWVNLRSNINPKIRIKVKAYVISRITTNLPSQKVEQMKWVKSLTIPLADPQYFTPNKIDLLLGAEIYSQILQEGVRKDPQGSVIAQSTSLGWILSGSIKTSKSSKILVMHAVFEENEALKKFWEMEAEPINNKKIWTEEEIKCEEIFKKTTKRDEEGRYVVKLPLRNENPACKAGQSRQIAMRRFLALERRLQKDELLKDEYLKTFNEYLQLNHMSPVLENDERPTDAVYLPYHAVIREDKDTTKVRIVFDASCKGTNGVSLNDDLMIGPTLQMELRHIIMRWRAHPVTLVADIVKMYRQIKVNEKDTNFQRILWRESPEEDIKDYKMLRVTFGTSSAPYLAVKSLMQVALDEGTPYPLAAKRVLTDFYMDDLMTGCQSVEDGIQIYKEMNALLNKSGFKLQKWSSNSNYLLKEVKEDKKLEDSEKGIKIKLDTVIKILELTWNRSEDVFQYTVILPRMQEPVTKRNIISDISRLFDPLGWVAPSIIIAKVMIQKLWLAGIDWDEAVPKNILNEWITYRDEVSLLTKMNIPRWLGQRENDVRVELHGFSDASKVAYAAVVYIRLVDSSGNIKVNLLTAKTKVAPIKQISIPRLELCGAVLLAKLLAEVAEVMMIQKNNIHAWADSTVVLAWINSHPSRWKTFVANRVSEILNIIEPQQWCHIPSKQNPADCASRGLRPSELLKSSLWLTGPEILTKKVIQFKKPEIVKTDLEVAKVHFTAIENGICERFSSLSRLIRVVAYCRRFLNLIKPQKERHSDNTLTFKEIEEARDACIRICQRDSFGEEIEKLKRKESLKRNRQLVPLNPYLDEKQIVRVGGRLENASISETRKHPILMPKKGQFTALVIDDAHYMVGLALCCLS